MTSDELLSQATCAVLFQGRVLGTAWLCSNVGHLLTAGHILGQQNPLESVEVQFLNDTPRRARKIAWGYSKAMAIDWAVLKLEDAPSHLIPIPMSFDLEAKGPFILRGFGLTLADMSTGKGEFVGTLDVQNSTEFRLFRLRSQELGEGGYSGGAVFSERVGAVVAIQIEGPSDEKLVGRDTVLAMPLYRIPKIWERKVGSLDRWIGSLGVQRIGANTSHFVKLLAIVSAILLLVVAIKFLPGLFFRPFPTATHTVVLGDFTNKTDDPVFDGSLRQALVAQFEQSPWITLVPEGNLHNILGLMGRDHNAPLTPELTLDICQRAQAGVAITGFISQLGAGYELILTAAACQSGDTISVAAESTSGKAGILAALGRCASELRAKLGESPITLQKYDVRVELATTPLLEALKAYSQGREQMVGQSDSTLAIPFLRRAIELDPSFAMAYAALGTCYFNLGQKQLAAENTSKAYELRSKVSDRERFYIESHYYHLATGELDQARDVYETWSRTYPTDAVPPTNLGDIYGLLGRHDASLECYKRGLVLAPRSGLNFGSLFDTYVNLDRFQDAEAMLEEMKKTNTSSIDLRLHLYEAAFYRDDTRSMSQQVEWGRENPDDGSTLLQFAAETSAFKGHLGQAREWTTRAIDSVRRQDRSESRASFEAAAALREALLGDVSLARRYAFDASKIDSGREVQYAISLALAFTGKGADSSVKAHVQRLARTFPKDTLVQSHFIPTIMALQLLSQGKPSKALQVLQTASAYELGVAGVTSFSPNLYPIYVRGEVYLMEKKGKEADEEFGKIGRYCGLAFNGPVYIMARIGVGRALALQGDEKRARQSYKEFLEFWNEADSSMPILISVKQEAAAIHLKSSSPDVPIPDSR